MTLIEFMGSYAINGDHFIIEDLLDFPNDNGMLPEDTFDTSVGASTDTAIDTSCNSSFSGCTTTEPHSPGDIGGCRSFTDDQFSNTELCMPHDGLAELEWLSNFVEETFSSEDLQRLQLIQGMKARTDEASETHPYQFHPQTTTTIAAPMLRHEMQVPAKARSKRSRSAHGNWTSRLSVLSLTPLSSTVPAMPASSESDIVLELRQEKP
ncbi:GATA transcription factor 9 [Forsythia ovata]|uniref:GATA transcription factor 9 n=1 Tax=Forsythia ovata TaxID=205694 RepID=A0ABD1W1R5_9LAMI